MKWTVAFHSLLKPLQDADRDSSRQGFTRSNTKSNQNLKAQYNGSQSPNLPQAPPMPPLNSPSISSTFSQESAYNEQEPKKFLNEKYAKCSVKGNFLTLAAQPKNVELGEWLAHQCACCHGKERRYMLIGYSGGNEPTAHGYDPSHSRGGYQHWSGPLQRCLVSYNVCWTVRCV